MERWNILDTKNKHLTKLYILEILFWKYFSTLGENSDLILNVSWGSSLSKIQWSMKQGIKKLWNTSWNIETEKNP